MRTYVRMRQASILHADVDSFFASVEQRDDPRLQGKPVIVGGGVVLAASYEAKAFGVHSAMGGARARRLCPQAIEVPPRFSAYTDAGRAVFKVFKELAPSVEALSMEEAFLDVSGLGHILGTPVEIATRLRREVRRRVGLPVSVGVASTKHLAKIASGLAKPDGLLHVPAGQELAFLHPLEVERIWGVGPATAARLHRHRIATVGDLAGRTEKELAAILGRASARQLHALAHNRDPRRVRRRRRRSIGSQSALGRRPRSHEELDRVLVAIVDRVTRRMRGSGRSGRTVILRLRFGDYARASRSRTMPHPTAATATILPVARRLLAESRPAIESRGLTLLGLTIANLDIKGAVQLELPLDGHDRASLDGALDELNERFGSGTVVRASLLGRRR
jgi:DNA polymerase IV